MNTGFSPADDPESRLPATPLRPGGSYLFWLEVGELIAETIEATPVELREIEGLPAESRLKVVLFHVGESGDARTPAAEGELTIAPDGSVVVSSQPAPDVVPGGGMELFRGRLLFPVDAPRRALAEQTM